MVEVFILWPIRRASSRGCWRVDDWNTIRTLLETDGSSYKLCWFIQSFSVRPMCWFIYLCPKCPNPINHLNHRPSLRCRRWDWQAASSPAWPTIVATVELFVGINCSYLPIHRSPRSNPSCGFAAKRVAVVRWIWCQIGVATEQRVWERNYNYRVSTIWITPRLGVRSDTLAGGRCWRKNLE